MMGRQYFTLTSNLEKELEMPNAMYEWLCPDYDAK